MLLPRRSLPRRYVGAGFLAAWCAACVTACASHPEPPPPGPVPPAAPTPTGLAPAPVAPRPRPPSVEPDVVVSPAPSGSTAQTDPFPDDPAEVCAEGMKLVDTVTCPDTRYRKVGLKCESRERDRPNNLTICREFAPGQRCESPLRRQRYCIDTYEYPNKEGAHPPVMVSAYDAAKLCAEQGKRMCFESEWTAACEGPRKLPFPHGYKRDPNKCNIDNKWRQPNLEKVHHHRPKVRDPELARLDQGKRSGEMAECGSEFGVHDLTGNFDEWVRTEWPRGKGKWAGLKGGAWGHVRNACRPITTSHVSHWSYYFISFRCCADANDTYGAPAMEGAPAIWLPPKTEVPPHPAGRAVDRGWSPDHPEPDPKPEP